jgi:hypothetical protein
MKKYKNGGSSHLAPAVFSGYLFLLQTVSAKSSFTQRKKLPALMLNRSEFLPAFGARQRKTLKFPTKNSMILKERSG